MHEHSPRILTVAPQAAPYAGRSYGLWVDQEDEQREEPAAGDEDAHPSKVSRACFDPVSAL
jgi:hypothetical protein